MGNPLSPFIADIFMSNFEEVLANTLDYFPKIWIRYVDDIFAVFDLSKCSINRFLETLNTKYASIKFTYESESNGQLAFLDTLVIRNNNRLEFDIYRKITNTDCYIPSSSNHPFQHKIAAFNFLVHRLISFPLTPQRYNNELQYIKNVAKSNGYDPIIINRIINKFKFKKLQRDNSTLNTFTDQLDTKYISLPFDIILTKGLNKILKKENLKIAYKNTSNIKELLGNPKDKEETFLKSGIYKIKCGCCDSQYIGQTKRSILTRFKEHIAHFKYNRFEKSAVAQHIKESEHPIRQENLFLVKSITNQRQLDAYESIEILKHKNKHLLNQENGPISSSLFELIV